MKQSFLAITLCLAILFGLTACSKVSVNISDPTTSTPVNNTGISDAGNETEESTDSTTTTASNSTETTTTEAPAQNTTTKVNAPTTTKKPVVTTTKQQTPTTTAKPASQWDLPARGNEELLKQRIIYYINEYRAKEGTPKEIEYIKSILPITKLVLETAQFDVHLLKAPILANHKVRPWGYQKGPNYGFENTKAMVHNRDGYQCQYCKGKRKDRRLEAHHIVFRSKQGSDDAENLITLCRTCHEALHDGKIHPNFTGKTKGTLKYVTQMNSIRKQLFQIYPDATETFGYITKANRLRLGIDKAHYYDACVIATQGKSFVLKSNLYKKKCVPAGDFQQTKGVRSEQPIITDKICGFRKFDKVRYLGNDYFIKGRMSSGYAVLMDIDGNKADFSAMPKGCKTPKMANFQRLEARSTWMVTAVGVTPNTA